MWKRETEPCREAAYLPGDGGTGASSWGRAGCSREVANTGHFHTNHCCYGRDESNQGGGGETNGRIPDFWFRARGARKCVGLRQESLKDPRSDSVQGFYACGAEPEPCLASPLPLRSDSGVEPQSRWWGGRGGALNTECERSVR